MRPLILAAALLAAAPAAAEPLLAEAPAPEPGPLALATGIKIDGFADAYFKYNPNGIQAAGSTWRTFDQYQNQAALGGGRLGLRSGEGALALDLYFGDYAKVLAGNAAPIYAASEEQLHLGQAALAQSYENWTLTLGRYFTHVGYETVDSVANWNFTRGLLKGQEPFFHTGIKVAYQDPNGFGLLAEVDNGNSNLVKPSEAGGGGAQLSFSRDKRGGIYGNYYYEPVLTTTPRGTVWESRHFLDVVGSLQAYEGLDVAAEYLYLYHVGAGDTNAAGDAIGTATLDPNTGKLARMSPKSQGYALYLSFSLPYEGWSFVPRYEAWYMPDAYRSDFSYTGTLRHSKGALSNWLEVRQDVSTQPVFAILPKDASTVPAARPYSELTITWAVGYSF